MTNSSSHVPASLLLVRRRSRWAARLRAGLYLAALLSALLVWFICAGYARAERSVERLGDELVGRLGPMPLGPPQPIELNGQRLFLASQKSSSSVAEVLDRAAARCRGEGDTEKRALPDASDARAGLELLQTVSFARLATLRSETEEAGMVACLALPPERRELAGVLLGVRAFMASSDLSELGDLHYVTARKRDDGSTHVVAVWTQGEFRLGALFPADGDASGSDMTDVPRPPASTRALSAAAPGRAFALRIYDTSQAQDEVLAFYDRELPKRGWESLALPAEAERADLGMRAFTREGAALTLTVHRDRGGTTSVSLVDLGRVARSTAPGRPSGSE